MSLQGGQMRWCYHARGILSTNKEGVLAWSRSIYIGTRLRMEWNDIVLTGTALLLIHWTW